MEQQVHSPEVYDYRQYDRVWQRVAPALEPYPGMGREETPPAGTALARQESRLPGAEQNPCCMGSAAQESLEVLGGFIEEELASQRQTLTLCRQAPVWARQQLRELAMEDGAHARRLMAVWYLITGECYRPAVICGRSGTGRWCPALRERYHTAACGGMNYARAAEETTDPCLRRLLEELSGEEYRQADVLLAMLERSLRNG